MFRYVKFGWGCSTNSKLVKAGNITLQSLYSTYTQMWENFLNQPCLIADLSHLNSNISVVTCSDAGHHSSERKHDREKESWVLPKPYNWHYFHPLHELTFFGILSKVMMINNNIGSGGSNQPRLSVCLLTSEHCQPSAIDEGWYSLKRPSRTVAVLQSEL